MGRKKKVQSTPTSGLAYSGSVTIKQIKGNKILKTTKAHNAGLVSLFNFICDCLIGRYDDNKAPRSIQILKSNGGTPSFSDENRLTTSAQVLQSASRTSSSDYAVATFKFLVPGANINSSEVGDIIALYNNDNQNNISSPLAWVLLGDDQKIQNVPADVNILIEWELKLFNASVQ